MIPSSSYNDELEAYVFIRRLKQLEPPDSEAEWWLVALRGNPGQYLLKKYPKPLKSDERRAFIQSAQQLQVFSNSEEARSIRDQIPQVVDFGVSKNGIAFIVLENPLAAVGVTLRRRHRRRPVSLTQVQRYAGQISGLLTVAHAQGVSYLNCDPYHVRVRDDGTLLLLDFKLLQPVSENYDRRYSGYLAPEQFSNNIQAIGPAADQYALAVLTHALYTGKEPRPRNRQNFQRPPSLVCVPAALGSVLLTATATNPTDRHQAIQDFFREFARVCNGLPQNANPVANPVNQIEHLFDLYRNIYTTRLSRRQFIKLAATSGTVAAALVALIAFLINEEENAPVRTFRGHESAVTRIALLPDGRLVSGDEDGRVFLWKMLDQGDNGQELARCQGKVFGLACLSKNGATYIAAIDGANLYIWDVNGAPVGKSPFPLSGTPSALAWAQLTINGQTHDHLLVAVDQQVKVYDNITEGSGDSDSPYTGHTGVITDVAFSPDRQAGQAASTSMDETVQLWDTETARHRLTIEPYVAVEPYGPGVRQTTRCIAWNPDSNSLAFGIRTSVQVWLIQNEQAHFLFSYPGHTLTVNSIAISHTGKLFASGSDDRTVHIFSWNGIDFSATRRYKYTGHSGYVNQVLWSRDDQYIISASSDTTVQVWRPQ